MPGAAAAAVGAAVKKYALKFAISKLTASVIGAIASFATSAVISSVSGASKPKISGTGSARAIQRTQDRTISVRQPVAAHRIIYGEMRVGGIISFLNATDDNEKLHQLITIAGHEVNSIGQLYLDDKSATLSTNTVTDTDFANKVDVYFGLGTTSGDSALHSALQTNSGGVWTSSHLQTGRAKIYSQFTFDKEVFSGSLPNVTAVVQGRKVFDPRDSSTAYSTNAALCIRDYLTSVEFGLGEPSARINDTSFQTAANVCDENITLSAGGTEKRYTLNGTFEVDEQPKDILKQMLSSCAGKLVYQGGEWSLYVGAYVTPTITLDEDDLDAGIQVTTQVGRRAIFNTVRSVYTNPANLYQPTDAPVINNSTYIAEDQSEVIAKDFDFGFTTSVSMAQRLAKVELEKVRQQITVLMPVSLRNGMRLQAGDTVGVSNTRMGWTDKAFNIEEWSFAQRGEDDAPRLGVDMVLRETASAVYDWNSGEETTVDTAPNTNLPDPFTIQLPTSFSVSSGTADLFVAGDGTVMSRIKATWTDSVDGFLAYHVIEHKKSTDSKWIPIPNISSGTEQAFISPVEDGVSYDIRIKAVNTLGVSSSYATLSGHTVIGKTAVPSNVTGFSAQQNGEVVTFKWDQVTDVDLSGYELRFDAPSGFVWGDAIALTKITRGTLVTNTGLPPGTWTVAVKAYDTSGNESATEATFGITIANTNSTISAVAEEPGWLGTKTNFILHESSGRLVPDSQSLANSTTDYSIFDNFVYDPEIVCTYEGAEIDIGFDAMDIRIYSTYTAGLGPGATGSADPALEVDYRLNADSYDGFESWTVGTVTARFIKQRVSINTGTGAAYLQAFTPTIDAKERSESASAVTIGSGGTAITFAPRFSAIPVVSVQATGTSALIGIPSSITTTGFTAKVFNSSTGLEVGGTINWTATGA